MKTGDFTIMGDIGDAFIKITKDGEVQLIFGEDDMSLTREMDKDLLPISLAGVESYDEIQFTPDLDTPEIEEEKISMGLKKDNVIQFKQRKDNEDK